MILQLHEGTAPEAVKKQLVKLLGNVTYNAVVQVEQELINEFDLFVFTIILGFRMCFRNRFLIMRQLFHHGFEASISQLTRI